MDYKATCRSVIFPIFVLRNFLSIFFIFAVETKVCDSILHVILFVNVM